MAAKKQTKLKTRTSGKKQGFKFRWWMGVLLVVIVAAIGIIVLRFSNAATQTGVRQSTLFLGGYEAQPHSYKDFDISWDRVSAAFPNATKAVMDFCASTSQGTINLAAYRNLHIPSGSVDGYPAGRTCVNGIEMFPGESYRLRTINNSDTPYAYSNLMVTVYLDVPVGSNSNSSGGSSGSSGSSGSNGGSTRRQTGCDVLLSNGVTIFVPYTGNCGDGYAAQEAVRIYYASKGSGSASAAKAPAPVQCDPYKSNCDDANWVTWDGVPSHIYTYKKRYYLQKCYSKEGSGASTRYINEKPCPSLDSGNFRLKLPSTGSFTQLNQFITGNFGFIRRSFPMSPDPQVENCSIQFKAQGGGCQLRNNIIKIKSDWLGIPAPNNNKKICVYTSGLTKADALNNKLAVRIIASNGSTVGILKPQYQPVLSGDGRTYQAYCQDLRGKADYKQADIYVEGSEFGMPAGAENAKAIEYWSWPQ